MEGSEVKKKPVSKAPIDCTYNQLYKIKWDGSQTQNFWIIIDANDITIAKQKSGEDLTQKISIPISTMRRFINFLTTPQELK